LRYTKGGELKKPKFCLFQGRVGKRWTTTTQSASGHGSSGSGNWGNVFFRHQMNGKKRGGEKKKKGGENLKKHSARDEARWVPAAGWPFLKRKKGSGLRKEKGRVRISPMPC